MQSFSPIDSCTDKIRKSEVVGAVAKKIGIDTMEDRISRLRQLTAQANSFCDLLTVCRAYNANALDASLLEAFERLQLAAVGALEALNGAGDE